MTQAEVALVSPSGYPQADYNITSGYFLQKNLGGLFKEDFKEASKTLLQIYKKIIRKWYLMVPQNS